MKQILIIVLLTFHLPSWSQVYDSWFSGQIKMANGELITAPIKVYNTNNKDESIFIKLNDQEKVIFSKDFIWLSILDTNSNQNRKYYSLPVGDYGFRTYEVLIENPTLTLLIKESPFWYRKFTVNEYGQTNTYGKPRLHFSAEFYIIINQGEIQTFSDTSHAEEWKYEKIYVKLLYQLLNEKLIKNFIKEKNYKLNNKEDIIKIVEYVLTNM